MSEWSVILEEEDKRRERKAFLVTLITYSVLIGACVFLVAFTMEIPPPGQQFVAVGVADFGADQEAAGERESEVPSELVEEVVAEEVAAEPTPVVPEVEAVETQETSEIVVPVQEETPVDPEPVEDPEPERIVDSQLSNALDNMFGASGGGGSEGASQGTGNQGVNDGRIEGTGVVTGDFGDSFLEGGEMIGDPTLDEDPSQEGVVTLKITVNKAGVVIDSRFDPAGSTTSSGHLIELAKRSAATARFSSHPTKSTRQGWIRFNFKLE